MTINIFMYIYIGEKPIGTYTPTPCKSLHTKKCIFFTFYFILDVYCYKQVTKNVFL